MSFFNIELKEQVISGVYFKACFDKDFLSNTHTWCYLDLEDRNFKFLDSGNPNSSL